MTVRPCILSLILLAAPLARAQSTALDPETIQFVRRTFNAANAAYDAGDYERARQLYLQAYKINATANITFNLARAELKLSRFVEAARHFSACTRAEDAQPSLRQSAREALQEAERHVGKLLIDVNVDGADVFVDAESFGPSPIPGQAVYVAPGRHVASARKDLVGEATRTIEVDAGQSVAIALKIEQPTIERARSSEIQGTGNDRNTASGSSEARPASTDRGPTSTRSVVLWTGAGVAVASLGFATYFALKGNASANDADRTFDTLRSQYGSNACSNPSAAPLCAQGDGQLSDKVDALRNANRALWIGGLIGVATAGAFFLWRPAEHRSHTVIAAQLSREGLGISLSGRF